MNLAIQHYIISKKTAVKCTDNRQAVDSALIVATVLSCVLLAVLYKES
jgi:hypothetical protein